LGDARGAHHSLDPLLEASERQRDFQAKKKPAAKAGFSGS
jgi:hypothetical protein